MDQDSFAKAIIEGRFEEAKTIIDSDNYELTFPILKQICLDTNSERAMELIVTSPGILDKKFRGFTLLQVVFMYGEMSDVAAIYEYVVPSQDHDWEKFLVATDDKGRTAKGFVEEILSLWSSKKYKELNEWLYPDENWTAEDIQRYGGWISDLQEDLLPNYLLPQNEESDEAPDEEMTAGGEGGAAI